MVAAFCLRLAAGLLMMLPILPADVIPPRFYRVHFLTALGLLAVAAMFFFETADALFWAIFGVAALGCVIGSVVWHLYDAPGGKAVAYLTPIALTACLVYAGYLQYPDAPLRIADEVCSALVVGSAMTAMLMGHSYLIAPAMTISPLMRLFAAGAASVIYVSPPGRRRVVGWITSARLTWTWS